MNQYIIGLPRALLYYKYQDLWKTFFEELGCKVIVSEKSNQKILEEGIKKSIDEACLALKIYMGHIDDLKDKCDYILVPRIICLKKYEKLCTNFSALYDIVRNTYPRINILNYNIDVEKKESELFAFLKMGQELGYSYIESIKAYQKAKEIEKIKIKQKQNSQELALLSEKPKILLVGHPYNLHDPLIGENIIKYLKENKIEVILSDSYDNKNVQEECNKISKRIYWTWNKDLLGAITHYKNKVDGIILLTTFPCGPDSLCNEMCLRKINSIPIMNLIVDELQGEVGLVTRLESFIDIMLEKKKRRLENEQTKSH